MTTRWIIPISLAIFAVISSALWAWLSLTQRQLLIERVTLAELDALHAPHRASPPTTTAAAPPKADRIRPAGLRGSLPRRTAAPSVNWKALADRMDEQSVRMRQRARDTSYARAAAGWAHLDADRPVAALAEFDRVLARHPDDAGALKGRAEALARLGRYDEAAAPLLRVTRLHPNDADARYNCGALLYRLSRFTEASEQFREVVALRPHDARAWFNLAGLAQRDGRLTEARDAWIRFTTLQPDVAEGWFNLGLVRFDLDDPIGALFDFTCAAALDPTDPDMRLNMAAAWETLGDPQAAHAWLIELRTLHPCDPVIEQALNDLERSLLHAPDDAAIASPPIGLPQRTAALPTDGTQP